MYPVLSYWGSELGYVQRRYVALAPACVGYPKAMNLITDFSEPFVHFPYLTHEKFGGTLTVVEDIPSAEAVNPYAPCAALLGTNITDDIVTLFLKIGVRHLRICLDNDALAKAAKLRRSLSLVFETVTVVFVDKDPKDMKEEELYGRFSCNS